MSCMIVAEIAQAHDGSYGNAHAFIDAVARAGAGAVKLQHHDANRECVPDEPWRVEPRWKQDASRYAYWRRMEFTPEQWRELAEHARAVGLRFLCSPFSVEAVALLDPLVDEWKVPSGEIAHRALLEAIRGTGKPVILSTGMATRAEIAAACAVFHVEPRILQCTSAYPTRPEQIGLAALVPDELSGPDMDGLSDHSGTIWPGLAAVALGAHIVEVHVCWSREQFGPDTSSSITIEELAKLVEGARFIEAALRPLDKNQMAKELESMRNLFMGRAKRKAEYDAKRTAAV